MLQTDVVVSPVRRSSRNTTAQNVVESIDVIDMTDVGYLPNSSLPASPLKKKDNQP